MVVIVVTHMILPYSFKWFLLAFPRVEGEVGTLWGSTGTCSKLGYAGPQLAKGLGPDGGGSLLLCGAKQRRLGVIRIPADTERNFFCRLCPCTMPAQLLIYEKRGFPISPPTKTHSNKEMCTLQKEFFILYMVQRAAWTFVSGRIKTEETGKKQDERNK